MTPIWARGRMFEDRLRELEGQHLLRRVRLVESEPGPVATIEGRPVIVMASNNYLGLATHPLLKQAAIAATARFGVGAGASRLVSGTLPAHQDLEAALARLKATEASLVFGSGYLANVGLIPSLIGAGGVILAHPLWPPSLIDGCRLSGATPPVFRHRDPPQPATPLPRGSPRRATL